MEQIIALLEEYWGLTIVGGITIGGVITLAVMAVKFFISMRKTQTDNATLTQAVSVLMADRQLSVERAELDSRINASIFKTLSYLTMSSKLPLEEKTALITDYTEVKLLMDASMAKAKEQAQLKLNAMVANIQGNVAAAGVAIKDEVAKVGEQVTANTATFVSGAVQGVTNLIDKYAGTK